MAKHPSGAFSRRLSRRALIAGTAGASLPLAMAKRRGASAANALRVAMPLDIDTFDPAFTVGSPTAQTVIQNVFDQLTKYRVVSRADRHGVTYQTVDTTIIDPMLCSAWAMDGADLVFTIPPGLVFANGDPIDATTFVNGYRRILEAKGISSFLLSMGNAVTDATAFEARDPRTFVIHMSKPNGLISQNITMHNTSALDPAEIAAHAAKDDPWATHWFDQHLASGCGPYRLASYELDSQLVLAANERHRGPAPFFTNVVLKIIPDANQRADLLEHGDVDLALAMPHGDLDSLSANAGVRVQSLPSTAIQHLGLNATMPPFDRKAIRQAVAWAMPYRGIIDVVFKGRAQPAVSLVPAGMPTSDPTALPYRTDLAKARALLAAEGHPGGAGLPPIELSVMTADLPGGQIAVLVEDALRQLGLPVTIRTLSNSAFSNGLAAGTLRAAIASWFSWINDPFYQLFWLTHSKSPANYFHLANARLDQLIDDNLLAVPGPAREQASREAQAIVADDASYVILCQPDSPLCARSDIAGYVRYNDELPRFALMSRTPA